jgi:Zn-dependent M16 (insulinase) family peptidase
VFGITFRTPPSDSTGIPHILEHSVLCGSRKYPVKEPFVDLLKGSLQNFLNAFTYPDRTCYPIASTNLKDFYNLINVYLDAVLHPRAIKDPLVLAQEGWHYELDKIDDPLTIKGVVYNEMKGVYYSPDSLLHRSIQQNLFPNNTYSVDSGGDPKDIPTLTYQQFQQFHNQYYHPSNSFVFFYGDDNPMERLNLLDSYLKDFSSISNMNSQVKIQKKLNFLSTSSSSSTASVSAASSASSVSQSDSSSTFSSFPRITIPFPISQGTEPKHMITINWLMNEEKLTMKESLSLALLDYLLIGTTTSELRKTLIESGLGESLIGGGRSDDLVQDTYSIGLKGVPKENVEKVEELIMKSLNELSKNGFPSDAIESGLNTLEFRLREFNTGGYPKGLALMLGKEELFWFVFLIVICILPVSYLFPFSLAYSCTCLLV